MRQSFGTFVLALASLFGILTAWLAASEPDKFAARLGLRFPMPAASTRSARNMPASF